MFRTNSSARLLSLTIESANAQQGAKRIRVGGWKRLKFNPNYYPVHEYGSPISKQKPVWQKNPRLPNNAYNVNKFFKTTNLKNVQRIYDEEEGERYLRSNEFESRMAMADSQANASNRFAKDTGTSEHPGIVPLHTSVNFGPFSCPILKFLDDLWAQTNRDKGRRGMMQNVMYSIRQIQLEKVAKMRKKHQPALDDYARLEEELFIVTELNINMIKSKLAKILTEESESKEKFLPDDIYLRVGALSPFGKEKGKEVEEHYQEVLDKMEKYKKASLSVELDPYKVVMQAIDNVRPTIDFQHIRKGTVGQVIVVPKPIEETRAIDYAFRWIIEATQTPDVTKEFAITKGPLAKMNMGLDRLGNRERLAEEFLRAAESKGYSFNKKLAHHKVAEAQRQYAQLYWSGKLVK